MRTGNYPHCCNVKDTTQSKTPHHVSRIFPKKAPNKCCSSVEMQWGDSAVVWPFNIVDNSNQISLVLFLDSWHDALQSIKEKLLIHTLLSRFLSFQNKKLHHQWGKIGFLLCESRCVFDFPRWGASYWRWEATDNASAEGFPFGTGKMLMCSHMNDMLNECNDY